MRAKPPWIDRSMPLLVGFVQAVTNRGAEWNQVDRAPVDLLGYALLLAGPAALFARRRHPVPTLLVSIVVTCVFIARGHAYGPVFLTPIIAAYNAVMLGHRRVTWAIWIATYVFLIVYMTWLAPVPTPGWFHDLAVAAIMGIVLATAEFARARKDRLAEREQVEKEEMRRQASEERLTMARELHDVLAHNISLIHVQASTALHLIDDHPEQARTALTTIKHASKDVLTEMRSVLNVLRDGAPRSPTAGLDRLDELVERSGLPVAKRVTGRARRVPPSVDRAGYRIVQEALTNVTRHAPGASVTILLDYGPDTLTIQVTDSGGNAPGESLGGGNGVPGMRERAAALGGTLTATPYGRGFRVEARLPILEEGEPV
ncbi:sensor histidine kinase [Streptosporangium fragile]|uniref:sensor histidine kinase n=1 Tax=Streptosporangium fragile TaxID=46186 RepID=UPI0031E5C89B